MAVRVDVGWLVGGFGRLVFCGLLLGCGFGFSGVRCVGIDILVGSG